MKAGDIDFIAIEHLLEQVVDVNPKDDSDWHRSLERYMCPFCRERVYGHEVKHDKITMKDINHDSDCAWVVANKQLHMIKPLADEIRAKEEQY